MKRTPAIAKPMRCLVKPGAYQPTNQPADLHLTALVCHGQNHNQVHVQVRHSDLGLGIRGLNQKASPSFAFSHQFKLDSNIHNSATHRL